MAATKARLRTITAEVRYTLVVDPPDRSAPMTVRMTVTVRADAVDGHDDWHQR